MSPIRIKKLSFEPPLGLSSPHLQTIISSFIPSGNPPPSSPFFITLDDNDILSCELSIPLNWQPHEKTVIMVHGLGGCHTSGYMVRMSRKLYNLGFKVVRVNMRGCGSGDKMSQRPYHGGISEDIYQVLKIIHDESPKSPIILLGFSLGGNIVLKLIGDLGEKANELVHATIAICPPIDLAHTAELLSNPTNRLYNLYYMRQLERQASLWIKGEQFSNIREFDCLVTAPQWGFQGPADYYHQCSSRFVLPRIKNPCHILFSADDPFIDYRASFAAPLTDNVEIWVTNHGGHMGFLSWSGTEHYYFWLDNVILQWILSIDETTG